MTAVAQILTPIDLNEQIAALLPTALSGISAALADGLSELIRIEFEKHSGVAELNRAMNSALPGLVERSFYNALLATEEENHSRRVAMLHLLSTAEFHSLGAHFVSLAATASASENAESLTTEEAATLLGVSRTHVISLIKSDALSASQTSGGHRRLAKAAVLAYKHKMKARQAKGLDAMMAATAEMGLYEADLDGVPQRTKRK